MIKDEQVKVRWNPKNYTWFREKGYKFTKMGDEFEVSTLELMPSTHVNVQYYCDFCGKDKGQKWVSYIMARRTITGKDTCNNQDCWKARLAETREYRRKKNAHKLLDDHSPFSLVPLKDGYFMSISEVDFDWVVKYNWFLRNGRPTAYIGSVYRYLADMIVRPDNSHEVVHSNGDRLDCRRNKLWERRKKPRTTPVTSYKGVNYHRRSDSWYIRIWHNKEVVYGGYYSDEVACANAYNYFAKKIKGEKARINNAPYMPFEEWIEYTNVDHLIENGMLTQEEVEQGGFDNDVSEPPLADLSFLDDIKSELEGSDE